MTPTVKPTIADVWIHELVGIFYILASLVILFIIFGTQMSKVIMYIIAQLHGIADETAIGKSVLSAIEQDKTNERIYNSKWRPVSRNGVPNFGKVGE